MREPTTRRARAGALVVLAFLGLALLGPPDCAGSDTGRTTLCRRAVPAIAPPNAAVEILHVGRAAAPGSVRVDYRLAGRPEATKARWIVCGFGPGSDLVSVMTQSGPVSGASVYLLKRYFLDTPEGAVSDPAPHGRKCFPIEPHAAVGADPVPRPKVDLRSSLA